MLSILDRLRQPRGVATERRKVDHPVAGQPDPQAGAPGGVGRAVCNEDAVGVYLRKGKAANHSSERGGHDGRRIRAGHSSSRGESLAESSSWMRLPHRRAGGVVENLSRTRRKIPMRIDRSPIGHGQFVSGDTSRHARRAAAGVSVQAGRVPGVENQLEASKTSRPRVESLTTDDIHHYLRTAGVGVLKHLTRLETVAHVGPQSLSIVLDEGWRSISRDGVETGRTWCSLVKPARSFCAMDWGAARRYTPAMPGLAACWALRSASSTRPIC